jgi:hypothetical protein
MRTVDRWVTAAALLSAGAEPLPSSEIRLREANAAGRLAR